jgi:hypothetical protein
MKVLVLTGSDADYLADGIMHGLRTTLGVDSVDYPKCDRLYKGFAADASRRSYGLGFTLYTGLLDDEPVDRFEIENKIRTGFFDLVVISNIWRQFGLFLQLLPWLKPQGTVVLDGADSPLVYPYAGYWWRRPGYWFLPRAHTRFPYFKREWTERSRFSVLARLVPRWALRRLTPSQALRPISFGIPEEKIVAAPPEKSKEFPVHIVDAEVASRVPGAKTSYAFQTEADYYADLQASRFGITKKRAGWDCLRHYEIAANGAVPCFRNLDDKPATCAPHGLSAANCVAYRNEDDLFGQIERLAHGQYAELQAGALAWARANSTRRRAEEFLQVAQISN